MQQYVRALIQEISAPAEKNHFETAASVFFGGGTPSLLTPDMTGQIMEALSRRFQLTGTCEITMEMNPGTISEEYLKGYRAAGINRASLGVQSLADDELLTLGRIHNADMVYQAVELLQKAGLNNYSLDLIYGLPGHSGEAWERTLTAAMDLEPRHISGYLLEIHPDTPLGQRLEAGAVALLDEDLEADLYDRMITRLTERGYQQYEISNFARPGFACRHNLNYWCAGDYSGYGPGAVSFLNGCRYKNRPSVKDYLEAMDREGRPDQETEEVMDGPARAEEALITGLRLMEGIGLDEYVQRFGLDLPAHYPKAIKILREAELLEIAGGRIRLSRRGFFLSNLVFVTFLNEHA